MSKIKLNDVVTPQARWSASMDEGGGAVINYQKELVDDAPGEKQDTIKDVGDPQTLTLTSEQAAKLHEATDPLVSEFINANEVALGGATAPAPEEKSGE